MCGKKQKTSYERDTDAVESEKEGKGERGVTLKTFVLLTNPPNKGILSIMWELEGILSIFEVTMPNKVNLLYEVTQHSFVKR